MPTATIALFVRNEERFLEQALESLTAQTFDDFELVVFDNASTDQTPAIVERFAAADLRVRYVRNERDLGFIESFRRSVDAARGEYFLPVSGHDLWSPDYLQALVSALESDRRATSAFGRSVWIDEDGKEAGPVKGLYVTEGVSSPIRRFNVYMWANQDPYYGVHRTEALQQVRCGLQVIAPAQVWLQELAILGEFLYVPEVTFSRRRNRPPEKRDERRHRYGYYLFVDGRAPSLPYWRLAWSVVQSARRGPLKGKRRRRMRVQLVLSSLTAYVRFWPYLVDDLRGLFRLRRSTTGSA